ncbi:MAG: 4-aminobutyrate--2-oxoglutarate transaminase [Candidatus Nanopelagicales bacterium]|nr:4-aminobutyrate--2-oxoglutarate transaminase [Candidatus Nanopelagicales bacterium]
MSSKVVGGPTLEQKRRIVTAIPGPKSVEMQKRRVEVVSAGVSSTLPVYVKRAGGGIVEDIDGNSFIDLASGIAVTTVGNSNPRVVANVQEAVEQFTHTCFMIAPYESYVQVCEALSRLTPGTHAKKSALFNSGAEALENAVKIARYFTKRDGVVVVEHGYHGRTNLTMAMTAKNMPYKKGFGPFAPEIYRVPTSYPFHDGLSGAQAAANAISKIEKEVGSDQVAAIVIEPIQGEGGFIVPAPGFLSALAKWAKDNGVLFIADEVQTGFARTGDMFASEFEQVVPDLITMAKGMGGGLPVAAVTGRADVMDSIHAGGLGGTYGGNPIALAGALGAIETIEKDNLIQAAKHIESIMIPRLQNMAKQHQLIGDVRGRGAMIAIEIVKPGTNTPDSDTTTKIVKSCHAEGVLVLTAGTYGNVLRFLPPLVINDELLNEGLDVLEKAIASAS